MFYFVFSEDVLHNLQDSHQQQKCCVCMSLKMHVCSMHIYFYTPLCFWFLCGGLHLYVYSICQKKLQKIHMYLINVDDNTPKARKKNKHQ